MENEVKTTEEQIKEAENERNNRQSVLDNLREDPGPTEKQLRNQRIWAGLGDALSGVAGLVSAAKGGIAIDTSGKTAIGAVRNAQEEERKKRREKFQQDYTLASQRLKEQGDRLAYLRAKDKAEKDAVIAANEESRKQDLHNWQGESHQKEMEVKDAQIGYYKSQADYNNRRPTSGKSSISKDPAGNHVFTAPDGRRYSITSGDMSSIGSSLFNAIPKSFLDTIPREYRDRNGAITRSSINDIIHLYANSAEGVADTNFWNEFARVTGNSAGSSTRSGGGFPGASGGGFPGGTGGSGGFDARR